MNLETNLKEHLNIKINIRGEVQKQISKQEFANWNKRRNVKFEIIALKRLKSLKFELKKIQKWNVTLTT